MSAALPIADPCCIESCDDVLVQNIPGPSGTPGTNGINGTDGVSAVTTLTVAYTMPAELGEAVATVASTAGFTIGETVYVQGLGTLQVTAISSALLMTLKNLEDAATSAYTNNAAPGTVAAIGSRISPTGMQGPAGLLAGGVAGGNLKGTYPNPLLLIPNGLGALAVGNGTDANSLSAGTNGQIPAYDSTQPLGMIPKSIIPITGGTNVAVDHLTRLSSATGTPIPLSASRASLKDPGGLGLFVADATTGNARGTDSVDLQVSRNVAGPSAVASGSQSVIGGGQDNTAFGLRSVVVGGQGHVASGSESFIGGGDENTVDSTQSSIVGGDENEITGGSANESFIGGGRLNSITGDGQSVIVGGTSNAVSGQYAAILGGLNAFADKHGQRAFSAGQFAAPGDCQQSDLIWRVTTTDGAMAHEAFLDGAAGNLRAVIPSGKTWAFDILVTARSLDAGVSVSAAWTIRGAIQNNAGTTSLVSAVTNAVIADGTGATWGGSSAVVVDADNTNDALRITVTGYAATTIRWGIHGRIMEVGH